MKKTDYTITDVWLDEDYQEGLIDIGWATVSAGFGHLSFDNKNGKIYCSSETMDRKFVRSILDKLVEQAIFDEDVFDRNDKEDKEDN